MAFSCRIFLHECLISTWHRMLDVVVNYSGIPTCRYHFEIGHHICQISLWRRMVDVVSAAEWRGIEVDPALVAVSTLQENDDLNDIKMCKSDIFSTLNGPYSFLSGIPSISLDIGCNIGPTWCCYFEATAWYIRIMVMIMPSDATKRRCSINLQT